MAKLSKILKWTAVGAVIGAGAYAMYKKCIASCDCEEFDEFDDEDFDDDFEDADSDRGYTAIPLETEAVDATLTEEDTKEEK